MTSQVTEPKVFVVILNWNGWQDTIECLESLLRSKYTNYQVILCDNDSQNQSVERVQQWAMGALSAAVANPSLGSYTLPALQKPITTKELTRKEAEERSRPTDAPLTIIRTGGNLGFAGGNNVGIRYALKDTECDFIWLLNNDTVVEPDCLANMVSHSVNLSASGVKNTCGSVQRFYFEPEKIQALGGFRINRWTGICSATLGCGLDIDMQIDHDEYRQKLHAIHGCSWLIPRNFIDELGLMEEQYFLYYEEIDWALRSPHYRLTYADDAIVYHKEGGSIGSRSRGRKGSRISEFYANHNKYRLAKKFNPWTLPTVFLGILAQGLNALRRGDKEKFWLLFQIAFGKSKP